MSNLKKRNNKAKCPVCRTRVARGSSANWCPTFHYTAEHMMIEGKDFLVAEFYKGADSFTVCVGYANTFFAPEGVSIRLHPPPPKPDAMTIEELSNG